MPDPSEAIVAAGYDAVYESTPRSPTLQRLWRENAVGGDFPEELTHISFATVTELRRITEFLRLDAQTQLIDLACGMGAPGIWLARESGASLTGVDISEKAIELAAVQAGEYGIAPRSRFIRGSFSETGLLDQAADAAVTFDALQYAPDKRAAVAEMARVLRPRGRLAFTAFELAPERVASLPVLSTDPVPDYVPLLERAGFTVTACEETPGWQERVTAAYSSIVDNQEALRAEMGDAAITALLSEVTITLQGKPYRRRVLALAEKPA
jgi:SAM-dependent methyltransferase